MNHIFARRLERHRRRSRKHRARASTSVVVLCVAFPLLFGAPSLLTTATAASVRARPARPVTRSRRTYGIAQPTRAHPLTILVIGDSLGLDLQYGMSQVLGPDPLTHVVEDAVGDTGLTKPSYYDWATALSAEIGSVHPKLVVVMLGANDWQGMEVTSGPTQPGTTIWIRNYNARVTGLMSEATAKGVRVLWVGLPIMGSPTFSSDMATLNAIYLAQARDHDGVWFIPTWKLFSTSAGAYSEYLPIGGHLVQVRDADGVHVDPPDGTELLGRYAVERIDSIWHIHI
ncbi:MAG: DUF459 domain-containing protein [Acidimicrobiales bacterium]